MRRREAETWTLRVVDALRAGHPVEDSRVELKRQWPDAAKAARRLAAHANAARGEEILWLIGVDEKARLVPGADTTALADWWARVVREFSELAPSMMDVNVPIGEVVVSALVFETDRAPFVVRNHAGGGGVEREVPWREGTAVRSATRGELIRLLAPFQGLPGIDVLEATVACRKWKEVERVARTSVQREGLEWLAEVRLYLTPAGDVALPKHWRSITVTIPGLAPVKLNGFDVFLSSDEGSTSAPGGLVVHHPMAILARKLVRTGLEEWESGWTAPAVDLEVAIRPAGAERAAMAKVSVPRSDTHPDELARWVLDSVAATGVDLE